MYVCNFIDACHEKPCFADDIRINDDDDDLRFLKILNLGNLENFSIFLILRKIPLNF